MSAAVAPANAYDFQDLFRKFQSHEVRMNELQMNDIRMQDVRMFGVASNGSSQQHQQAPLMRRNSNPVGKTCSSVYTNLMSLPEGAWSPPSSGSSSGASSPVGGGAHRKLDRSHSEPVERTSAAVAAAALAAHKSATSTSRYKTELCRPFEESGACKYGDKCQFAHGMHELRTLVRHPKYKTELCRTFHTIGFCPYGPRCHFIHNADEARKMAAAAAAAAARPKPLDLVGSAFSLGSTADSPSPPSSLSESPTSAGSFFADDAYAAAFSTSPPAAAPLQTPTTTNTTFPFADTTPDDLTTDLEALHLANTTQAPVVAVSVKTIATTNPMIRLPVFNNLSRQSLSD